MTKFKVGDKVKWNDGVHHHDDKRIDIITGIIPENSWDNIRYMTKEINNKDGETPKIGRAYENYLVLA